MLILWYNSCIGPRTMHFEGGDWYGRKTANIRKGIWMEHQNLARCCNLPGRLACIGAVSVRNPAQVVHLRNCRFSERRRKIPDYTTSRHRRHSLGGSALHRAQRKSPQKVWPRQSYQDMIPPVSGGRSSASKFFSSFLGRHLELNESLYRCRQRLVHRSGQLLDH